MRSILVISIGLLMLSCQEPRALFIKNFNEGPALGTSYHITYLAQSELNFQTEIDSVFEAVNASMSTYISDSDISRINNGDTTVIVDHMFREVFQLSKEVHKRTFGYFDPTVGVLVDAWGFGPGEKISLDSTKVDSLLRFVGFDKVSLNENNRLIKEEAKLRFDFNAIAKGYTLDRLAVLLNAKGIENYLIELGGEVVAKGENLIKKKPWAVGIEDPQQLPGNTLKTVIQLKNRALAASGNYRKFRIDSISGKKYVHTIDPITGFTKDARVLGANVVASKCAEADAYATAFMAMDIEASIDFLSAQKNLEAYIIYLGEEGEIKSFSTAGFRNLMLH